MTTSPTPAQILNEDQTIPDYLTCKPTRFKDITSHIVCDDLSIPSQVAIAELSKYTPEDLWGTAKYTITDDFAQDLMVPQWFLLEVGSKFYLVNTEGFRYCRYAARIVGVSKQG